MQRARVHNDVARAFFGTLAAQQSVVIHDRMLKVALDTDTNTHELARIGQADAAAILTAEVAAEQARVDFLNAQRMFIAHFARLATYAGQHSLQIHPLTGSLVEPPSFNPEEYVQRDVEESPLVKGAQADEALGETRLKDARRERIPNLNVTAGEWYSGEEVSSGKKAGFESFVQAGVQLPLWNRNQGNIEASKVLLDRAHRDVERIKLWTRNQTEPLAQQYMTAHTRTTVAAIQSFTASCIRVPPTFAPTTHKKCPMGSFTRSSRTVCVGQECRPSVSRGTMMNMRGKSSHMCGICRSSHQRSNKRSYSQVTSRWSTPKSHTITLISRDGLRIFGADSGRTAGRPGSRVF